MNLFKQPSPFQKPDAQPLDVDLEPSAGLFHSEGNAAGRSGHVSLNDYISKHLNASEEATQSKMPVPEPARDDHRPHGQILNSLDVDLTSGLEQYMPTPVFRLRVVKKRLDLQIAELRERLNKYERLPVKSPEMLESINIIHARLKVLERHEAVVNQELATILQFGAEFYWVAQLAQVVKKGVEVPLQGGMRLVRRALFGSHRDEIQALGQELQDLRDVFAEKLHEPTLAEGEIGQLFTRYEQQIRHMETMLQQQQSMSIWQRLWQPWRRLVQ